MILSDNEVREYLKLGLIKVTPEVLEHNIRPAGIRVHLGNEILVAEKNQLVDLTEPIDLRYKKIDLNKCRYILLPNEFVIGSTFEMFSMANDIIGLLEGRSTIARLGISIHCTSGIIDGMHEEFRTIVLEIYNCGNFKILLKPKIPMGMLLFCKLSSGSSQSVQPQYLNQNTASPPKLKLPSSLQHTQ